MKIISCWGFYKAKRTRVLMLRHHCALTDSLVQALLITSHWLLSFFIPLRAEILYFLPWRIFLCSETFSSGIWKIQGEGEMLLSNEDWCWLCCNGGCVINGNENLQDCWYWPMFGEFWTQILTYVTAPSFNLKKYVFDWSNNRLINLRKNKRG